MGNKWIDINTEISHTHTRSTKYISTQFLCHRIDSNVELLRPTDTHLSHSMCVGFFVEFFSSFLKCAEKDKKK